MTDTNNFITYCDSMMIATEGVKEGFQKLKAWIIKQLNKILTGCQKLIERRVFDVEEEGNDKLHISNVSKSKLKASLLALIARCKAALSKSKALTEQNPELAEEMKNEVETCQTFYASIMNSINPEGYRNDVKKLIDKTGVDSFKSYSNKKRPLFQKGDVFDPETLNYYGKKKS